MYKIRNSVKIFFISLYLFSPAILAQEGAGALLPGSVQPGVLSKILAAPKIEPEQVKPVAVTRPKEATPSPLGPEAAKIKFKLNAIIIEGNCTIPTCQLFSLYQSKLHKTISIVDLEGIVQSITNYYRNAGYILSRAILPPQRVAGGIVRIRVIEGYIAKATVQCAYPAQWLIKAYGNNIVRNRPICIKVMEHYLRLANEIPGVETKAVLEPSKTATGASDMTLVSSIKRFSGYLSYDNYGTRYIGPQQWTANVNGNSLLIPGDTAHITTVRPVRPLELKFYDTAYEFPLNGCGLRGIVGAISSRTRPQFILKPLKIEGTSDTYYGTVLYPWIRSRDQDLTTSATFNYVDSGTNSFGDTIYNDHIRSITLAANYNFSDSYQGSNTTGIQFERGFPNFLGSTSNAYSPHVSRFGANSKYSKFILSGSRLQYLFWRLSAFFYGIGQYTFNPLLASEQYAYGGSQLGRGYDPAEIIGDSGLGGSAELRMDNSLNCWWLQTIQPYIFYDAGVIWNRKQVFGSKIKQSATSTGFGFRVSLLKYVYVNLMLAQPLTKQVSTYAILGRGRKPRGFFSIVISV